MATLGVSHDCQDQFPVERAASHFQLNPTQKLFLLRQGRSQIIDQHILQRTCATARRLCRRYANLSLNRAGRNQAKKAHRQEDPEHDIELSI